MASGNTTVSTVAVAVPAAHPTTVRPSVLNEKVSKQIVDELLASLSQGNQDSRHAGEESPSVPDRNSISWFIKTRHQEAVKLAFHITRDHALAEDAVDRTYLELLEGKTTEAYFFRALKLNARDEMHKVKLERGRFDSLDAMRGRRVTFQSQVDECDLRCEVVPEDFASPHREDQDPIDILVQQEETAIYARIVRAALADPRWRYIKRRAWARPLAKCADLATTNE